MIGIYKITNNINGKVYIGQSWDIKNRWRGHKFYAGKENLPLYNSIAKYGWDNFNKETLILITEDIWTQRLLDFYETYFVYYYNSMDRGKGYNIKFPGMGGRLTPEIRAKMSKAQMGHSVSLETRQKMSEIGLGRKQSQETIDKRRLKLIGKKRTADYKILHGGINSPLFGKSRPLLGKRVKCVETGEEFESAETAGRYMKKESNHVSECCLGKRKTWNKLHWEYL